MKKATLFTMCIIVAALSGCGNFEWFPSGTSSGGGATPNPVPNSQTITEIQADTVTPFLHYTVAFGNITTSTTTATISVSGDVSSQYSKDNGTTFTSATGTVKPGDIVIVRNTSSNNGSNVLVSTLLNIGGITATYVSKTGSLIYPTLLNRVQGTTVQSNSATVPLNFTNNFVLGSSATIAWATGSDSSSQMYFNGSNTASALPSPIKAGDSIYFRHTAASASNTTITTKATLTGSTGTYDLTFKSTTQ